MGVNSRYAMIKKNGKLEYLHRLIMNATDNQIIDHINRNTVDNRKHNLRIATRSQNQSNKAKSVFKKPPSSQYKGVCYDSKNNNWLARVYFENKVVFNGRFKSAITAARAYNYHAQKIHGEFANLNEIDSTEELNWQQHQIARNKNVRKSKYKYMSWHEESQKWKAFIQSSKYGNSKKKSFKNDYEAVLYCNQYIIDNDLHILETSKIIQVLYEDDIKLLSDSQLLCYNQQLKFISK